MNQTKLVLTNNSSDSPEDSNIIVTVRDTFNQKCKLLIGYPGQLNSEHELFTGDAALYQVSTGETYEIRALSVDYNRVELLITKLASQPILAVSFVNNDPLNSPFNEDELKRIDADIAIVKARLKNGGTLQIEQLQLINQRLDEIQLAARRMGRKDWALYIGGNVTSICASAAFAPEVTRNIYMTISEALGWVLHTAPNVLLLI